MIARESEIGGVADDASLAERIRRGDRAAEDSLIGRYAGQVLATAMVRMHDREAARELVDDVLMATVIGLRRGTVHDTARLGAFIHGTTLNLVHNHLRARFRSPQTETLTDWSPAPDTADVCENDSNLRELRNCMARLRPDDSQILFMSLVDGLHPGEIATRLGLSLEVVRQHKSRALKRLKDAMCGPARRASREPLSSR